MGDIYEKATKTIIWLGNGKHGAATNTSNVIERRPAPSSSLDRLLRKAAWSEYWSRVWVIQEIMRSRDICLCYDTQMMPWNTFEERITTALRPKTMVRHEHIAAIVSLRRHCHSTTGAFVPFNDWWSLLRLVQSRNCKLRQDRIYGLLGLLASEQQVTVDYKKTAEEVFVDVAITMSRNYDALQVQYTLRRLLYELGSALGLGARPPMFLVLVHCLGSTPPSHTFWVDLMRAMIELLNRSHMGGLNFRGHGVAAGVWNFTVEYVKVLNLRHCTILPRLEDFETALRWKTSLSAHIRNFHDWVLDARETEHDGRPNFYVTPTMRKFLLGTRGHLIKALVSSGFDMSHAHLSPTELEQSDSQRIHPEFDVFGQKRDCV